MQQLYIYILIASLTIASPGPGVLLTLTNTLNYNLRNAMAGNGGHLDYCRQQRWRADYHFSADAVDRQGGRGGLSDLSGHKTLSLGAPRTESTSFVFRGRDTFRQLPVSSGVAGVAI